MSKSAIGLRKYYFDDGQKEIIKSASITIKILITNHSYKYYFNTVSISKHIYFNLTHI